MAAAMDQVKSSNIGGKSVLGNITEMGVNPKHVTKTIMSRDVEKIFLKICQSIELYTCKNIPIITEFLEF